MMGKTSNVVDLEGRRNESREEALDRLFREHGSALRSFLLKRIRNEAELEDLVQDVFIRLAGMNDLETRLPDTDSRKNRNFIFTVANNIVVDMERRKILQKEYQRTQHEVLGEKANELGPEAIVSAKQELSAVKAAIMELKPTWRKAFIMSRYNYMSYKEISQEMGVSVKQVENYMTNALIKLRESALSASKAMSPEAGDA